MRTIFADSRVSLPTELRLVPNESLNLQHEQSEDVQMNQRKLVQLKIYFFCRQKICATQLERQQEMITNLPSSLRFT